MKPASPQGMDLLRAIAAGELSAREALDDCIARIEATDGRVNAFTGHSYERAQREATAIDAMRARGEVLPPLAGLPYAVKNLFDVQGEVTLAGSKINRENAPAQEDAFLVQRLKAAGAVLVGSLNMDEYAYGFTTENTRYGPCHNPHDLSRIAGGSSGGSGAAVAARQVPLTLGSDTNGSIRVPASLCGVWGLKPTFGRLSRRGSYPFVHSIDHVGPLADSVDSLALAYDALQGPDPLDPGCHALEVQPVAGQLRHGVEGLRVGILDGYFADNASGPARAAVDASARALGAAETVEWPDAALGRAAAFLVTASEGGTLHLDDLRTRAEEFEPLSVDRFIAGVLQPGAWYVRAQRFRRVYLEKVRALFEDWDVLLAPATPVSAPVIGTEWLEINGTKVPSRPSMGLLTQPISFAGCPVVVAPMWPDGTGGMPIGVQLIAPAWREDLALRAGRALQEAGGGCASFSLPHRGRAGVGAGWRTCLHPNPPPAGERVNSMQVNLPDVLAEVTAAFNRYEKALTGNDVAVLDELFWASPHTLRYGATENLYGYDAICAFRAGRPASGLERELLKTVITSYGRDFAMANVEFRRAGSALTGRQSQTWMRTPQGWRVVAAHVSLLP